MININELNFSYGKSQILSGLSVKFEKGRIYGLLGVNGAGKTTLLKNIAGLLRPSSGLCSINGEEASKRMPSYLVNIYFLPESMPPIAEKLILYAKRVGAFYPKFSLEDFLKIAEEFNIDVNKKLTAFSAGQRKMAYISLALALNTQVLLLDEPTNGLDIIAKQQFRKIVSSMMTDEKIIILSTHQVRELENLIENVVILNNKEIQMNSSINEIADKLYFHQSFEADDSAIYCQAVLGGYSYICPNVNSLESKVNLEALFELSVTNRDYVKSIFEK